ncbi:hypothetical protein CC2G_006820 [Coprinopsis cinerea AmutBmut pab1-1]|nr:hypothetical protein CC2G_006820 [Coprinopsis cinerea AmutBmut pab1-1]
MIANDCKLDILQLGERFGSVTEVMNILAQHPEWDKAPRRLKLSMLDRAMKEVNSQADHLSPQHWRGDVNVRHVSLQTAWSRGRRIVEEEYPKAIAVLESAELTYPPIDFLAPGGTLLFDAPLPQDDLDESLESFTFPLPVSPDLPEISGEVDITEMEGHARCQTDREIQTEIEEELGILSDLPQEKGGIERTLTINGQSVHKSRILAMYGKYRKSVSSTDRLKRVQQLERYTSKLEPQANPLTGALTEESFVMIHDPVATLLCSEKRLWLCLGEVNSIRYDGQPVDRLVHSLLSEPAVSVSFQVLGLRNTTIDEDPTAQNDWRTVPYHPERTFEVPGRRALRISCSQPRQVVLHR